MLLGITEMHIEATRGETEVNLETNASIKGITIVFTIVCQMGNSSKTWHNLRINIPQGEFGA